jgi:hypothetical protein
MSIKSPSIVYEVSEEINEVTEDLENDVSVFDEQEPETIIRIEESQDFNGLEVIKENTSAMVSVHSGQSKYCTLNIKNKIGRLNLNQTEIIESNQSILEAEKNQTFNVENNRYQSEEDEDAEGLDLFSINLFSDALEDYPDMQPEAKEVLTNYIPAANLQTIPGGSPDEYFYKGQLFNE